MHVHTVPRSLEAPEAPVIAGVGAGADAVVAGQPPHTDAYELRRLAITGRVLDERGQPLAARIHARPFGRDGPDLDDLVLPNDEPGWQADLPALEELTCTSASDTGQFTLELAFLYTGVDGDCRSWNLLPSEIPGWPFPWLLVRHPGYVPLFIQISSSPDGHLALPLHVGDLRMRPSRILRGWLVDQDQRPVAGAHISLPNRLEPDEVTSWVPPEYPSPFAGMCSGIFNFTPARDVADLAFSTVTDAAGRFELDAPPGGRLWLDVDRAIDQPRLRFAVPEDATGLFQDLGTLSLDESMPLDERWLSDDFPAAQYEHSHPVVQCSSASTSTSDVDAPASSPMRRVDLTLPPK